MLTVISFVESGLILRPAGRISLFDSENVNVNASATAQTIQPLSPPSFQLLGRQAWRLVGVAAIVSDASGAGSLGISSFFIRVLAGSGVYYYIPQNVGIPTGANGLTIAGSVIAHDETPFFLGTDFPSFQVGSPLLTLTCLATASNSNAAAKHVNFIVQAIAEIYDVVAKG